VVAGGTADEGAEPTFDVVAAWTWVETHASVRDRRTKTPGEIAREAATRGWPREPTETLLRAYRNLTYAGRSLDDRHRAEARQAFERIRAQRDRGTDHPTTADGPSGREESSEGDEFSEDRSVPDDVASGEPGTEADHGWVKPDDRDGSRSRNGGTTSDDDPPEGGARG
jgi:hypothetical protein